MSKNLEHNEEHREQARDLVIEQFKRSQKFNDWLGVYIDQVQDLEDALWQLYTERGVDTAEGIQLDVLGVIVGQDRLGLDDTDYRTRIKVRIRLNRASGIADDIYDVFGLMLGNQIGAVDLQEVYPAGLIVQMNEYVETSPSVLAAILKEARGAGIDTSLIWLPSEEGIFECSSDAAPETGSATEGFATAGGLSVEPFTYAPGFYDVAYSPTLDLFVAVNGTQILSSPDGENWTVRATVSAFSVAWSPSLGMFAVTGANAVNTSTNGTSWTARTSPASRNWYCAMWAEHLGQFMVYQNTFSYYVMYSSDGVTWSEAALTGASSVYTVNLPLGIAYSPTLELFVAVNASELKTSSDGVAWTSHGAFAYTHDVTWVPALAAFVAGYSSDLAYSLDGTNWVSLGGGGTSVVVVAAAPDGAICYSIGSATAHYIDDTFTRTEFTLPDSSNARGTACNDDSTFIYAQSGGPGTTSAIVTMLIDDGSGGELAGVLQA